MTYLFFSLWALAAPSVALPLPIPLPIPRVESRLFERPVQITANTRIIDVRTRDAWLVSRIAGSIYLNWEQFSQPGARSRGTLRISNKILAEDLRLAGISVKNRIVLVGDASAGRGNEGRMAWLLARLGFQDITLVSFNDLAAQNLGLHKGPFALPPTAEWKVKIDDSVHWSRSEFEQKIGKEKFVVLNVIDPSLNIRLPKIFTDLNPVSMHWKDFIDSAGRPTAQAKQQFQRLGLSKEVPILVISFAGLSSAYVTLILRDWGFQARLIPEGISDFLPN